MLKRYFFIGILCLFISSCNSKANFNLKKESEEISLITKSISNQNVVTKAFKFEKEINFNDSSLSLTIKKNNKEETGRFVIGFLYENDFENIKNVSQGKTKTKTISGNLDDILISENKIDTLKITIKLFENTKGFFIQSAGNIEIIESEIVPYKIGFDCSIPELAFNEKSYVINGNEFNEKKIDLSELTFNSTSKIVVMFAEDSDKTGKVASVINVGKEKFYLRKSNTSQKTELPIIAIKNPQEKLFISENANQVSSIMIEMNTIQDKEKTVQSQNKKHLLSPIKIDPGLVMWWPKKNWRGNDYELFEWDRFSGVLVMDIANYAIQDDFFRRLAYFVEKAGFRGKLYSDSFLQGRHGYNAHDYKAENLAEFFEKARKENFKLNEKEYLLEKILIENGVIQKDSEGKYSAGKGAVISISQESPMYLRSQFIAHEGWHGIYFVDEDFRKFVNDVYQRVDIGTRNYLIKYFQVTPSLNYDTKDDYLLKNEFMAYMLQKPVNEIAKYFIDMASRQHSQEMAKEEADYIIETNAIGFVKAAKELDAYVNKRWNLNGGRVWLSN